MGPTQALNAIRKLLTLNSVTNTKNDLEAILVDAQSIESTYSQEITTDKSGANSEVIIDCPDDHRLIVHDVFLSAAGNVGEIKLDFDDDGDAGDPVARLYTSQFNRASFSNMTLKGEEGEDIEFDGNGSSDSIFVVINYIEVEVE